MTWSHLFVYMCLFQIAWALREGFQYVHLHGNKVPGRPSCLWKELFHFLSWGALLLLSISPIPTSYPQKITFSPSPFDTRFLLSLLTTFYQQLLMKNTETMSWVWSSLTNNIWCTSAIWMTWCCFKAMMRLSLGLTRLPGLGVTTEGLS